MLNKEPALPTHRQAAIMNVGQILGQFSKTARQIQKRKAQMGELVVQSCDWDNEFVEIVDRSGNQIWVRRDEINTLTASLNQFVHECVTHAE